MLQNPQNWGVLGPRSLAVGAWLTPLHTCYPAEIRSSTPNGIVINAIRLKI